MTVLSGIGYDVHQFAAGRPLVLGGVQVPSERGLVGHSDADVLTHAVIDALLGAAGLGDIGEHFPDTDEQYRGADSLDLLAATLPLLGAARPVHVDATVVLEAPKLADYKADMAARLSAVLGCSVNVKATRGEKLGWIGRGEGAACLAIATVARDDA
ncbi:MAG: 2-C-methyl-D-erythritol 2,4-cyclodiphosphate synthase [Solirubrobacterales bacterium]|nr:2-C-methyl-D-erythritol 2,4-cyclodiphosphate synthase [Solirubrobacterales bacterium]